MDGDRDLELLRRHRRGDAAAFDQLYLCFSTMVYNVALQMSGDPDEAAEAAQEVFLRVHRHLATFRGRSSLKTWIYRVTLNTVRSRLKRRARRRRRFVAAGEALLADVAEPRRNPEERALARERAARLRRALVEVRQPFREAVVLRDLQGLSYAEIAAVLGVRVGTVRSRIARGREQLRLVLEGER